MRLKVPFYKQTTLLNCGPTALRMALAYLDKDYGLEVLENKARIREGKGISTVQIATVAASLGYRTTLFSKYILFNEENLKLDFYKNYNDMDLEQSKRWVEEAKAAGVKIEERTLTLDELLSYVTKNSIPIVLVNWKIINEEKEKGYQGHFVPIVGYDDGNVYVHNAGLKNPQEFFPVKREIFDEARKANGTDEDIIILYKK